MDCTLTKFADCDTDQLLECWRSALPFDEVTLPEFQRRVLLDDNFDVNGLMVAKIESRVVGFISCFILRKPIEGVGVMPDRGFIQAFGVSKPYQSNGIGSMLLTAAEEYFKANQRQCIVIAPYTPNYFVPGVDKDNYANGVLWLQNKGFSEYSEALAADANIATFSLSDELLDKEKRLANDEGIVIRHLSLNDVCAYMNFQREYMPGPWVEDSRRNLKEMTFGRFSPTAIWIALQNNRIVGFCQHENEHFGPFGVCDDLQGKGIGSLLLAHTLLQMRIEGCHSAWVLWTGERALKGVYGRLGFKLTRRFSLMKKSLV